MKKIMSVLLMGFIGLVGTCAWAGSAREDTDARLQSSVDVLHAIMATPDKGIPEEVLSDAKRILVVPNLIKVASSSGASMDVVSPAAVRVQAGAHLRSSPVGGGSWGLQIGVEGVALVMLVMNDQGMQQLLSSKFQVSGEGSAAAGPVG